MSVYMCMYIYIYIYRERERERERTSRKLVRTGFDSSYTMLENNCY